MKYIIFITLMAGSYCLRAQTTREWTQQKATRIEYMIQQLSANRFYLDYLQKGYSIAQAGLQTINDIRHADFDLHSNFFKALSSVNPKVKNLAKVTDIIAFQIQMIRQAKQLVQRLQSSDRFTATEMVYIGQVFNHLFDECTKNMNELAIMINPGQSVMNDAERVERIDGLYSEMQDKLSFSKSFSNEALLLLVQRLSEEKNIELSRKLNGVQ